MRVLHLNIHASGGSYEYAALLSAALAEQGIESRVLYKNSQRTEPGRVLLDRVIRRAYVSLSTQPWHGTRRLLCPPGPEELKGVDVVHLHTVADWFDVPSWLETLPTPRRCSHQRARYVACDWRLLSLPWMRSVPRQLRRPARF